MVMPVILDNLKNDYNKLLIERKESLAAKINKIIKIYAQNSIQIMVFHIGVSTLMLLFPDYALQLRLLKGVSYTFVLANLRQFFLRHTNLVKEHDINQTLILKSQQKFSYVSNAHSHINNFWTQNKTESLLTPNHSQGFKSITGCCLYRPAQSHITQFPDNSNKVLNQVQLKTLHPKLLKKMRKLN